jgi:hypothetical protein
MTQAQDFIPTPSAIYTNNRQLDAEDKVDQIRHLALIGIAANDSNMNVAHLDDAMCSLFEVIIRLAQEVNSELEMHPRHKRSVGLSD